MTTRTTGVNVTWIRHSYQIAATSSCTTRAPITGRAIYQGGAHGVGEAGEGAEVMSVLSTRRGCRSHRQRKPPNNLGSMTFTIPLMRSHPDLPEPITLAMKTADSHRNRTGRTTVSKEPNRSRARSWLERYRSAFLWPGWTSQSHFPKCLGNITYDFPIIGRLSDVTNRCVCTCRDMLSVTSSLQPSVLSSLFPDR